jgi:hypothetical protein
MDGMLPGPPPTLRLETRLSEGGFSVYPGLWAL